MTPEEQGRAAFEAGLAANPYDARTREGREWAAAYRGARSAAEPDVYVAIESGAASVDGQEMIFVKGVTRVRAGHPLLRACPSLFKPADAHPSYDVEQATAAPGERRAR